MSIEYWGVVMHGVQESDLRFKDEYDGLLDVIEDNNDDYFFPVKLPNGKVIELGFENAEDDEFFGFYAGYPWESRLHDITQVDVEDAIVQVLLPYLDMTEAELRAVIDDINTYNCG